MTKLADDVVIDEIREIRHRISKRFDHDPRRLAEHYAKLDDQYRDRMITSVEPRTEETERSAA